MGWEERKKEGEGKGKGWGCQNTYPLLKMFLCYYSETLQ